VYRLEVSIDGTSLRVEDVVSVARKRAGVIISEKSKAQVQETRRLVDSWISQRKLIYGITTGVGPLLTSVIPNSAITEFQHNLIVSHAAGAGANLDVEAVRAGMLVRTNVLAKGLSGIRLTTLETLVEMLNKGVHPLVPEYGSVGASGDLTPLAHIAQVVIGEGKAEYNGNIMSGKDAMRQARIKVLTLSGKEGLSLINGTSLSTGISVLNLHDAENILKIADLTSALCVEALNGCVEAFDERLQKAKPHLGQINSAENIRRTLQGSGLIKEVASSLAEEMALLTRDCAYETTVKIQDAYALRCSSQILGACRDAISFVRSLIQVELNSATDNPLVFSDAEVCLHGGNFHGQPIALAMDTLCLSITEVGVLSERRIARLLDEKMNGGLPAFLVKEKQGLQSGLMAVQYLATELTAENRVFASPVSIGSIPTNNNNEDVVSMAMVASRKAAKIIRNVEVILAIEVLCELQAIDLLCPEKLSPGTKVIYKLVREDVPPLLTDRSLNQDLEIIINLIRSGIIVDSVQAVIGALN
jgi:histidine ammonia-lyase